MNDIMSKNYTMTFSDGSVWAVPVSTIALHRAGIFIGNYGGDLILSLDQDTLPLFSESYKAIRDWATENMSWADVADDAVKISEPTTINFEKEWIACSVQIK